MQEQNAVDNEKSHNVAMGQSRKAVFLILTTIFVAGCGPTNKSTSKDKTSKHPNETIKPSPAIKLPEAGPPISAEESVVIIIRFAGKDKVTVHRGDGQSFTDGDNGKQEQEVIDYVEAGLIGAEPFNSKKLHVLIKAEKSIKHKEVARIHRVIGRAKMNADVVVETVFIEASSTSSPQNAQEQPE